LKLDKQLISELPKWGKSYKLCTPFFAALDLLFSVFNIEDESLKKRYLQLTLNEVQDHEKQYAHKHITHQSSLSWDQVKSLFVNHFENQNHYAYIKQTYRQLKYTHHDTIQSFSHRFLNAANELSYDVDSKPVMDYFIDLLPLDVKRRFAMHCQHKGQPIDSYTSIDDLVVFYGGCRLTLSFVNDKL
jgi:hypothetical protein